MLNNTSYGSLEFRKIIFRIFHITMEAVYNHRNFYMDFIFCLLEFLWLEFLYTGNGLGNFM